MINDSVLKAQKDFEHERAQKEIKRIKLIKQNEQIIKENERIKSERKLLKKEENIRDQQSLQHYVDMLEKQYIDNKNRKKVHSTLEVLPETRQMNIYGLTMAQEDAQMLKKMKQDEADDTAKQLKKQQDKMVSLPVSQYCNIG